MDDFELKLRNNPFTEFGTGVEQLFTWFDPNVPEKPFVLCDVVTNSTDAFATFDELSDQMLLRMQQEEDESNGGYNEDIIKISNCITE